MLGAHSRQTPSTTMTRGSIGSTASTTAGDSARHSTRRLRRATKRDCRSTRAATVTAVSDWMTTSEGDACWPARADWLLVVPVRALRPFADAISCDGSETKSRRKEVIKRTRDEREGYFDLGVGHLQTFGQLRAFGRGEVLLSVEALFQFLTEERVGCGEGQCVRLRGSASE